MIGLRLAIILIVVALWGTYGLPKAWAYYQANSATQPKFLAIIGAVFTGILSPVLDLLALIKPKS